MNHFSTSLLTANEMHTASWRIDSIINENLSKEAFIAKVEPLVKAATAKLEKTLGRVTDSSKVKLLYNKDKTRDVRFVSFRDFCKGFLHDSDVQLSEASELIVNILKGLGWTMYLEGYATESSLLQALFQKLDEAPAKAALTTLGATAKLAELKTAHADFEKTFNEKVDSKIQDEYPRIRECRVVLARYLDGVISYIDLMAEIDGGLFKSVNEKIEEVIIEFEAIGRTHQTRAKNEKKAPGTK